MVHGLVHGSKVVVAYKILVSAPVPLELILTGLGLGLWGLGFGTGLDNISSLTAVKYGIAALSGSVPLFHIQ